MSIHIVDAAANAGAPAPSLCTTIGDPRSRSRARAATPGTFYA